MANQYSSESERLKVILETLAFAHPDMLLVEAISLLPQIEEKVARISTIPLEYVGSVPASAVADWIDGPGQEDVIEFIRDHKRINAIKECRSRYPYPVAGKLLGLKEAKEGVEEWCRRNGWTSL